MIVNESLSSMPQVWLMAGVYLAVAFIVVIATGPGLARKPATQTEGQANRNVAPMIERSHDPPCRNARRRAGVDACWSDEALQARGATRTAKYSKMCVNQ